jgi:hypothetical protein
VPNIPPSLTDLLQSEDPPEGFLNWFTEAEVRSALQAGTAGNHEAMVRAWLHAKERERLDLERAAASAARADLWNRAVMWIAIIAAILALIALLVPSSVPRLMRSVDGSRNPGREGAHPQARSFSSSSACWPRISATFKKMSPGGAPSPFMQHWSLHGPDAVGMRAPLGRRPRRRVALLGHTARLAWPPSLSLGDPDRGTGNVNQGTGYGACCPA